MSANEKSKMQGMHDELGYIAVRSNPYRGVYMSTMQSEKKKEECFTNFWKIEMTSLLINMAGSVAILYLVIRLILASM